MSEQSESRMFRKLAESISMLAHELCEMRRERIESGGSRAELATKCDIRELKDYIMATQAEVTATLKTAAGQQKKTIEEIKGAQVAMDALNAKIVELQALITSGTGGDASPELVEAANEVAALAHTADEALPDIPPPVVVPV